jgi:uncharacterized protein YjcR
VVTPASPSHGSGRRDGRGARLDSERARAVAECIAAGERHTTIAERFGVSVETVGAIKSGKRWASAIDDDLRARVQVASPVTALDASAARKIMAELEAGRPGRVIAEKYGISASMVSAIKHGRAWSALDPDLPVRLARQPRRGKSLSAAQVAAIKQRLLVGRSARGIAAEFGVSASTVLAIARGKTWAEVEPELEG